MRITHVIPALTKGGAERVVVDLANAAVEEGHNVTLVAAIPAAAELIAHKLRPQVRLRYVSGRSIRRSYLQLVPWLIRERSFLFRQDVIHCHLTFGSVFAAAFQRLRRLSKREQPAVVETYHAVGMAIPDSERARHAFLLRGRDAVAFMADDPYWRRFAAMNPRTIFRTILNGVAAPEPATREDRDRYRKANSIPLHAHAVVGTVSRLVSARRPDLVLEAFRYIASELGPGVHLLMAGEGPQRSMLERTAKDHGITSQVHLPGLVLDPAVPISLMDIYLTVNVGRTTGIAAIEAALLGVPILALQLQSGYRAEAEDWIWSSPDPRELGSKAVELLADRQALAALAARQTAHARARFSARAMADAYSELYQAALQRQPS